jgi:ubiquinone/menaquinone biosynthesis C-methylase UbiE
MNKDVERFERWSSTYEHSWIQRWLDQVHSFMVETVAAEVPRLDPKVVLDVGCGTGRLLRRVAGVWPEAQLVGVDPATGMIDSARKLAPTITFYQAVAESLPLADASVDLAFSAVSLHHWQNAAAGIQEVERVLGDTGIFCLVDISIPSWLAKLFRSKARSGSAIRDLLIQSRLKLRVQRRTSAGILLVSLAVKTSN